MDLGTPALTSQSIPVTINIQRNNNPPVFINEVYTEDITDSFFLGANILRVTATDADISVSVDGLLLEEILAFFIFINVAKVEVFYSHNS